jgi:hypothetical protein
MRVRNPAGAGRSGEASRAVAAAASLKRCRAQNLMGGLLASESVSETVLARWKGCSSESASWTGSSLKEA